jgi:hypothetical protein
VKSLVVAVCVVSIAACDPSTPTLTTMDPSAPTTTLLNDTCERLATDTARYLELVVAILDETPLDEFRDREAWTEPLFALEEQGDILDSRAERMACDPARIQAQAFAQARLNPQSGLSQYLLELWGMEG